MYQTVGKVVGGYIEIVHPVNLNDPYVMIVNEEGLLHQLPMNVYGSFLYGLLSHGQPIVGTVVFMKEGYRDGEPDIVGLTDEEAADMMQQIIKQSAGLIVPEN